MTFEQLREKAFSHIERSFVYDDILHTFATGEITPRRGQLEAIKLMQNRADRLMEFLIEKPAQVMNTNVRYIITREEDKSLSSPSGSEASNPGQQTI